MDCFRQKRRRKKQEREQQKFRHLTPHTSPAHSQPSTLSHGTQPPPPDPPRLPKVGSYGLWVGAPGIYASTPSPAYSFGGGRSGGSKGHPLMQPAVMQRASSDPRLLPSRGPVYSSGGGQQRIYHSQGIPSPLSPVYELRDPQDGSVYDVYQIGGGSTTRLLQESTKSGKGGKRLQRSQSDVVTEPSRRAYRTKPSSAELRASRASSTKGTSPGSTTRESSGSLNKPAADSFDKEPAQIHHPKGIDNPIFIESVEKIAQEEKVAVVASATDSMKLLAKNKTDDQKTVGQSSPSESKPSVPENTPVSGNISPSPALAVAPTSTSSSLHYTFQGDIYAVPDKEIVRSRSRTSDSTPPQSAVSEPSGAPVVTSVAGPVTEITETAGSLVIDDDPGYAAPIIRNPIYQEVSDLRDYEPSLTHSSIYEEVGEVLQRGQDKAVAGSSKPSVGDDSRETVSTAGSAVDAPETARVSSEVAASEVAAASAVRSARDVGASGETEEQAGRRKVQEQWSFESEGTADDLTRAGKHISVTAEAFEFLDTYLSDEDGADMNSPPKSPVLTGRSELM